MTEMLDMFLLSLEVNGDLKSSACQTRLWKGEDRIVQWYSGNFLHLYENFCTYFKGAKKVKLRQGGDTEYLGTGSSSSTSIRRSSSHYLLPNDNSHYVEDTSSTPSLFKAVRDRIPINENIHIDSFDEESVINIDISTTTFQQTDLVDPHVEVNPMSTPLISDRTFKKYLPSYIKPQSSSSSMEFACDICSGNDSWKSLKSDIGWCGSPSCPVLHVDCENCENTIECAIGGS